MVQLQKLTGSDAGMEWVVNQLPIKVGRSAGDDLQIPEAGIWDHHFQLVWNKARIRLEARPEALTAVNGQTVTESILRNGDVISLGEVSLRFWLGPPIPKRYQVSEALIWIGLVSLVLIQFALYYLLSN